MKEDLMDVKRVMKQMICVENLGPNYPVNQFAKWVEGKKIRHAVVSVLLGTIQTELDTEEVILLRSSQSIPDNVRHLALLGCWRLYCSQLQAYYKTLLKNSKHPGKKNNLVMLL